MGRGPVALADLPLLSPGEFQLLLSLLDRLLAAPRGPDGRRAARSADGRLRLLLEEPEPGRLATVETAAGRLTLPAWVLTVEDALARSAAREATA